MLPEPPSPEPAVGDAGADGPRWLIWALVPISLLSNPAAAIPWGSYFFRDFSIALLPYRLFAAREWAQGRWPGWNPYLHEGTFLVPALYPGDLLHALWPSPALISWLLTLHFPLAAMTSYLFARDLGAGRRGAFVAGSIYSLGGLAVSSLNLYVFLQALAWAPAVVASLRRAALLGGRWVALAALVLGAVLPVLALEFLGQAILLGVALALLERPRLDAIGRLAASLTLAFGLAALPIAVTAGFLPETARGAGFASSDALAGEIPPAALVQTFVHGLLGFPSSPFEGWWGPFFKQGSPYFLTLYFGPLSLALAATGWPALGRSRRLLLLAGMILAVWFALGDRGGLAPLARMLPGSQSFRSPGKAFFFVHLTVPLLAGLGLEQLAGRRGWSSFARGCALLALATGALAGLLIGTPAVLAGWLGIDPAAALSVRWIVAREALQAFALAAAGLLIAAGVLWGGRLRAPLGALLVGVVAILDLARAGAGVNPQVPAAFYDLLPELASHIQPGPGGDRVFTYGLRWSPAFRADLQRRSDRSSHWVFWLNRQMLTPFVNMMDGIESGETPDLIGWGPQIPELLPEDYDPAEIQRILPRLRGAGVTRILSLDPLRHDDLSLLARAALPQAELAIHVYALRDAAPRTSLACQATRVSSQEQAFRVATDLGFDHARRVVLEEAGAEPGCGAGSVAVGTLLPTEESYETDSDGAGYLVVRRGFARGWTAFVDGSPARVQRADGRYRAVLVPAGRHRVTLVYRTPGLWLGLASFASAAALTAVVAARAVPKKRLMPGGAVR